MLIGGEENKIRRTEPNIPGQTKDQRHALEKNWSDRLQKGEWHTVLKDFISVALISVKEAGNTENICIHYFTGMSFQKQLKAFYM